MNIGFIGFGRMGSRLAYRLVKSGYSVVGYDVCKETLEKEGKKGIQKASTLEELIVKIPPKRLAFVMVPAVNVDNVLAALKPYLTEGDIVVDAGNSYYKDSIRRAEELKNIGVFYLDAGTSGGLDGALRGASFTVGGKEEAFRLAKPIFEAMAVKNGIYYIGKSGTGHFVKMVHNAIEYGILEAYAEGFELLKKENMDVKKIAEAWKHGSIIRSWILSLITRCLENDPELSNYHGKIGGGESGSWAVEEAKEKGLSWPSIIASLEARIKSQTNPSYASKLISALREEFGGHKEPK